MKTQKIIAIIAAIAASTIGGMSASASAIEAETPKTVQAQQYGDEGIMPCFTVLADCWSSLTNEGNGKLKCVGGTIVRDGYRAGTIVELQQYQNGSWTTIKTWSGIGNSEMRLEEYWYVAGGSYQLKITHVAYSGNSSVDIYTSYSKVVNV